MKEHELKIIFRPGRTGEENWEILQPEDIDFWKKSIDDIKQREYFHDGCRVFVEAEWTPVIRKLKKEHKAMQALYAGDVDAIKVFSAKTKIPVKVKVSGKNDLSKHHWYPNFFLEHYAYEIFSIMNLARPGVCDFFNLELEGNSHLNKGKERHKEQLSSFNFEFAWELSLRKQFPLLDEIPLEDVISWYENLNLGVKQKASKPMEKALFSLLHICKTDGDISAIVWVFHALEALFSTRVGEGFSNLINRISITLNLNPKEKSILKKNLRKLYDMRSSLVHGGYEIYHPMRREVIDRSIDAQYGEIYDNLQFGISITLACIQMLIKNEWYGIDVSESVSGRVQP